MAQELSRSQNMVEVPGMRMNLRNTASRATTHSGGEVRGA
jgi:hypothetical protein